MRKLKLQMQLSVDGYVSGPNGEMDWIVWNWDDDIKNYVRKITEPVDCILLGRNLAEGFIPHWVRVASDIKDPEYEFGRIMQDTPKVVFSKSLENPGWKNTEIVNGEITDEINRLKNLNGGDMIVYGGSSFVSALIKDELIDEFNLFINPTVIGVGKSIFKAIDKNQNLKLIRSDSFKCGIVLLCYQPAQK